MQITIDHGSERAVYQQIIDQVKRDIAMGRLKTGQRLPTVRELSAALVINPNTIAKAYRQLEQDGIIVTRPGAGAFVAELSSNLSRAVRRRILHEQLELLVVEAIHMQIDSETLREWFENTLKKFRFDGKGQTDE
ncbi:MAG TPA: GntR family transcriptional regulator [Anaerohalosphaeraceae bacterium]|jgi:GntR family transcriptional regulator|nr:GntR family transcriptional regulator [Anaerohalosphaeraceae bacterium]HRT50141.1 GntR family transcriptional regulator [Anaerohalosphaeraceae bacterium]HRT86075.1 GntR family transcriptional regulator [Anaerohalosphaeraceae bacterium]